MRYVAVTGGIGSGKSYVCALLAERGICVYDCDAAARRLMRDDKELKRALQRLVGGDVFQQGVLQKSVLSRFLLASEANKQAVNSVVHPAVAADFLHSGYTWLESAILFDSGFYRRVPFDYRVCVAAPLEMRLERMMRRDGISRDKALEWVHSQMLQEEVTARCDFVIVNDGVQPLGPQVDRLLAVTQAETSGR